MSTSRHEWTWDESRNQPNILAIFLLRPKSRITDIQRKRFQSDYQPAVHKDEE